MTVRCLPIATAALAWAAVATAAPLDLSAISAEAQWLMHFDMDAARESTVLKRASERAVKMHPQAEQMMTMGCRMMGMDPRKDLRDITAYGDDTDKRNGVMIVRAKANRELLEQMAERAPDHETMRHRKYTLHSWTHKGWKGTKRETVVGAFHRDDVMVFAKTPDRVKAALDVLDGGAKSAEGDGPLSGRVRPGSIVVARAAAVDPETKCPVLKQGRAFRVAMGESGGKSFYRAKLDMTSPEAAADVEDVVEGMQALGRLRFGDREVAQRLIEGCETKIAGSTCMLAWDASAEDVWAATETVADQVEAKMKADAAKRHARGVSGSKGACGCEGGRCECGTEACQGCDKCPTECPLPKGSPKQDDGALRDDEF